jgi:hypothetical protein
MSTRSCRSLSLALVALPLVVFGACKSDSSAPAPGLDARADSASTPDAGPDKPNTPEVGPESGPETTTQPDAATKADTASDDAVANKDAGSSDTYVYFVKQANGTNNANLADGTITVSSVYTASGNAFKYVAPNYYGTSSNGFISLPTPMAGDFSISAEVTINTQNKSNNACGVGLGITTGFAPTDTYAYMLMRNNNTSTNGYYVNGSGTVSASPPTVKFTNGTPLALTFSRSGKNVTFAAGPVGETATSNTVATSILTDGTNVYGDGAVYPAVSFNNVEATIAKLIIKDADGKTVFDSATGGLVNYIPAALTLSASSVSMKKDGSATVTATATAVGGGVSAVTATSADTSVATVSVSNGDTNSTLTISGLKGGVTTITVTNSGDSVAATNTKTILVAVNDYPTTDNYGSKALTAYPAPGATDAYADGELALTFDSAPTLNKGGTIKIFKLSDGTEVDSIGFADEAQTYGTTAIKVAGQLARVDGNTVYFTPHLGKIAYATGYYVVIPTTSITGTLNGVAFNGLSDSSSVATWKFTTKAAPTLDFTNITVDGSQTSTATFRSLATALNTVATNAAAPANVTINVAAGTYRELLRYAGQGGSTPQTITILGPSGNKQGDNCVFQFANGNGLNGGTATRASFYFTGANLVLQNITLKNTAVRSQYAQAETLYFASGGTYTLAAYNSSFISNQDTVQTSGRNWFYKCYFEGNVDFLWGTAQAALFEDCKMHFINDLGAGNVASYSMIVARTGSTVTGDGTIGKGYVVLNSAVTVDADINATFGRNAGVGAYYDQAALINVAFSGDGTIASGMWNTGTVPTSIGDASYVGWKSTGCTGLNLGSLTTASVTSSSIADQASEYDTRDHILNRVVTIKAGTPTGYEAVTTAWDVSSLATAWGAP